MIQQLVQRLVAAGFTREQAAAAVLLADPLDLVLHVEEVWDKFDPWAPNPRPAGLARTRFYATGAFFDAAMPIGQVRWDHLIYAYIVENTRVFQIMRRVLREYRSGEGLGVPSVATQRWLDAAETLLYGAANPISPWLSTSAVRPDAEGVRRNAYWRLMGMDLSFGTDDNRPFIYDKATSANTTFVGLFEELLYELWQAISNIRNSSGVNASDNDRIYRLAEQLRFMLSARRQYQMLGREEIAAVTVLGWLELTLSSDSPVVIDLRAQGPSAADRLKIIGERVGLAPHSRAAALFSMSADASLLLRTIEAGYVSGPEFAWLLYDTTVPPTAPPTSATPLGSESRRVITEWSAATGKDLKSRARPVETGRSLVSIR